ncbi:hypothetical protein FRUB_03972 [Fimbriiglobus ruber]|uniref:YDG domain-containing protein n=1 Tax=Fimbriiglobus ruber TaxID=1908690 RepID=A0A225DQK0_9BACT|nr:hypothetical protein FRUB_03972 [Fimbriiglobus ruber]
MRVGLLEDRIVPATITWDSADHPTGGSLESGSNWLGGVAPGPNDDAVINLTQTGTVTASAADAVNSITTNAKTTLEITGSSLALGAGNSTFGGPVTVDAAGALNVNPGANVTIEENITITVDGSLNVVDANSFDIVGGSLQTEGIVLNGTMTVTGTTFGLLNSISGEGEAGIQVDAGGHLSTPNQSAAVTSTFNWDFMTFANGSVLNAGDIQDDHFLTTLYVPVTDVPLLADNLEFQDVDLNSGSMPGAATIHLAPLGTADTVNQRYVFDGLTAFNSVLTTPFVVPSGAALDVDPGASVFVGRGVTITVNGALNVTDAASFEAAEHSGTTAGITVNGTMAVTGTTFSITGGAGGDVVIQVGAGGRLSTPNQSAAVTSTFNWDALVFANGSVLNAGDIQDNYFHTTLYIPAPDVPLLTNNLEFQDIDLNSGSVSGAAPVHLVPLGTADTVSQRYVFTGQVGFNTVNTAVFDIPAGSTLDVDPGATVLIEFDVTIRVFGALNLTNPGSLTVQENDGAIQGISVSGTLTAVDTDFDVDGQVFSNASSKILVNAAGQLNVSGGSFNWTRILLSPQSAATIHLLTLGGQLTVDSTATIAINQNDFSAATVVASGSSTAFINLVGNDWGTTDDTQILTKITDHHTNASLPTVVFDPALSAEPAEVSATPADIVYSRTAETVPVSATVADTSGPVNEGTVTFQILEGSTVVGTTTAINVIDGAAATTLTLPTGTPAGTYTILASYSGTANFSSDTDSSQSLTITPAPVTIAGITAADKVYDHTTVATLNSGGAAVTGVFLGDEVNLVTTGAVGTFAGKDVGTGIGVAVSGLTLGGAQAGDYTLTEPTATASITPAPVTVTGITAADKVYDQTAAATLGTAGAELNGVFPGDGVTLSTIGAVGTFADRNVGTGIAVAVTGLTLGGAQVGDYTLIQPSTTAGITPAQVTVTGVTAADKVYDHTTTAALNVAAATVSGAFSGDAVNLITTGAVGTFAGKDVGTGITVTVAGLTLGGAQAGDYTLIQPSTTAGITPAQVTVTGVTAADKVYDHTTTAALNVAAATVSGAFSGDVVNLITTGAVGTFADKDVGTGITVTVTGLTLEGAQTGDYVLTQPTATADITPATLSVTGMTAADKVYDHTTAAAVNTGSAALVGIFSGDVVALNTGTAAGTFADKDVGTGITVTVAGLTLGGAQAEDYTLTQPTTTASITPRPVTVAGVIAANKVYDGTTGAALNTAAAMAVGVVAGDAVSLVTSGAAGTFVGKDVGTGIEVTVTGLTLGGGRAGDYTLTQPTATASITPRHITVTARPDTKTYDQTTAAVALAVAPGDLQGTDTAAFHEAYDTPDAGTGKTLTPFGTVNDGDGGNDYTYTFVPVATGVITPVSLAVTGITAADKVYDGTAAATLNTAAATLVGVFGGDVVRLTSAGAVGTFAGPDVGTGIAVAVTGLALGGAEAGDYTLIQPTATAGITPAPLTVTGITAADKVYDGTTAATLNTTAAVLAGVLGGDAVTLNAGGAAGTFVTKDVGTGVAVMATGLTLGGIRAGDYTLTQPATTADITPVALAVTGITAADKVYDGTTAATLDTAGAALTGVVTGDVVTLDTGGAKGTFASPDPGTGIGVTISGLQLAGPQAADYVFTPPSITANITTAPVPPTTPPAVPPVSPPPVSPSPVSPPPVSPPPVSPPPVSPPTLPPVSPPPPGMPSSVFAGSTQFAVGTDAGGPPLVESFNANQTQLLGSTPAFASSFTGGVRVVAADFNNDGVADIAVGTGPGVPNEVTILDGKTGAVITTFQPFEASFTGGIFVAAGDVTGDGIPDLIVTPDQTGGPVVAVYDGTKLVEGLASGQANGQPAQINRFFGIQDPNFRGGARAAAGDINGDGVADIVVSAGFSGGPRIAGFDGKSVASGTATPTKLFADFFAFEPSLTNGAYVAVGDINGDGHADVIAGGGPGGGPRVTIFDGAALLSNTQTPVADFFAGDPSNRGGVRVAVKDLDGTADAGLVVGSGTGAGATVTGYTGKAILADPGSPTSLFSLDAFPGFTGGVFVG